MSILCNCPRCKSPYVQPWSWIEIHNLTKTHTTGNRKPTTCAWLLELRCPNCALYYELTISLEQAKEYVAAYEDGKAEMDELVMALDANQFIGALNADAILPEDFA